MITYVVKAGRAPAAIDLIAQRTFETAHVHALRLQGFSSLQAAAVLNRLSIFEREMHAEAMEIALRELTIDELETLLERKRTFG